MTSHAPPPPPLSPTASVSVSHLIIFNPELSTSTPTPIPSHGDNDHVGARDKDLEDDIREASQILFYTSHSRSGGGGRVSRDTMLRQFGLAKGMMGFTDMVLGPNTAGTSEGEGGSDGGKRQGWWGVHSHKSRMIIMCPVSQQPFYIYLNISLAPGAGGGGGGGAISDHMVVNALERGYDDFRLLHGPLSTLMPPSPATSSALDRFWTKFAHSFESTYLIPSQAEGRGGLETWLGGWPASSLPASLLAPLKHDVASDVGLIGRNGPLTPLPLNDNDNDNDRGRGADTGALMRFLVHQLHLALPPPPIPPPPSSSRDTQTERSTLGLGFGFGTSRKKAKPPHPPSNASGSAGEAESSYTSRASSWTSWVGIGNLTSTPASSDQGPSATEQSGSGSRWPSFGFSGVGHVFGLGTTDKVDRSSDSTTTTTPVEPAATTGEAKQDKREHHVEQSAVVLPDLEAAVRPEDEKELSWEHQVVWLRRKKGQGEGYEQRRVSWIIRDEVLLYVVHGPHDDSHQSVLPDRPTTLQVFASLSSTVAPIQSRSSIDSASASASARPPTPTPTSAGGAGNGYIYSNPSKHQTELHDQYHIDPASMRTLAELKDTLTTYTDMHEIHAKTAQGKFLVAKHALSPSSPREVGGGGGDVGSEVYIQVGRKDATLTDAEYAVRSVSRLHPDIPV